MPAALEKLRDAKLNEAQLAKMVLALADDIVAAPKFAGQSLDINIVRALLYLQRSDPRIDQRVRQYLYGRQLTDLSHEAVAALDPNTGEGRAFEIIESLGRLMWTVDRAALVFCIDQVEDLRFFDDSAGALPEGGARPDPDRQPRADLDRAGLVPRRLLRQGARGAGAVLHRPHREGRARCALEEARTAEEARLIIAKRLAAGRRAATAPIPASISARSSSRSSAASRRGASWSWRRRACASRRATARRGRARGEGRLHLDAGRGARLRRLAGARRGRATAPAIDFRELWERFTAQSEAEIPPDDQGLLDVLAGALALAREEWGRAVDLTMKRPQVAEDLPAVDLTLRHETGFAAEARIFLCNRPTQGGGFKRQLDRVLPAMMGKNCFMLRASDFPPNKKNQTAQAFRKFREGGGRSILVPITDWERMMMVREFHAQHRQDPGFADWFEHAKLLSEIPALVQMLRLDLFRRDAGGGQAARLRQSAARPMARADAARPRRRSCRSRSCSTRPATARAASWPAARCAPTRASRSTRTC